jgi:hypothetical protein
MNTVNSSNTRRLSQPLSRRSLTHGLVAALAAAVAVACGTGCVQLGLPQTVKALASDTNSVAIHVSTPWGTADLIRNARQ